MRVITGSARGTKLDALEGEATRPTTDKVKEALFSMIQFDIEGRKVLDLFGGSGQLALEALSRGAEHAVIIDESRAAVDIIVANARKTHLIKQCRILASDYSAFIRGAAHRDKYDIIFLDPPYNTGLLEASLKKILDADICATGAYIVCECDTDITSRRTKNKKDEELSMEGVLHEVFGGNEELMAQFNVDRTAVYGRTRVTILTLPEKDETEAE